MRAFLTFVIAWLLLVPPPPEHVVYLPLVKGGNMAITYTLITPDSTVFSFSSTDYDVEPNIPDGFGLPPVRHETTRVYNRAGAVLRSVTAEPRVITISAVAKGSSQENLHVARAALMGALRWNRADGNPPPPSHFRYTANGHSADLHVYYMSDVTSTVQGTNNVQVIGIRLIAYDPLWYATSATVTELVKSSDIDVSYVVGKYAGGWNGMGNAGTGQLTAIAVAPGGGTVYVGGDFTNWDGIAGADYVAAYDVAGGTWSALGAGVDDVVYGLAIDAAGNLYAVGEFHNAGVGAAAHVAKWNGAAWSALGAGLDDVGNGVSIGPTGIVYVGGAFHNAGGGAAAHVAQWNGAAWSALGAGTDSSVNAVLATPNGHLFVGGTFTSAGAVSTAYVAEWDGSTWLDMLGGLDGTVYALAQTKDGSIIIGGGFTGTDDGRTYSYITRWNGVNFFSMNGPNFDVKSLGVASNGLVYAGGTFTSIDGNTLPDKIATWNGTKWAHLGIDLPGAAAVNAIGIHERDVFLGFNTSGTATAGPETAVTNAGSADVFPVITVVGPGTLQRIENRVISGNFIISSQDMIFDMYVNPGETITIDLSPDVKTVISDWRGDMMPSMPMLPMSDFATFRLLPAPQDISGDNPIEVYMTGTDANSSVQFTHYDAWMDVDEAVD